MFNNSHIILYLLLSLVGASCSNTTSLVDETPSSSQGNENSSQDNALETLYYQRLEEARMRFTEADVNFMTGMIAHHAQALVMSDLAPGNGASAEIKVLAARIINAQKDEIATMQQWLEDRGQPVPEVHIEGINLMVHGVDHHHMHMPGMLTSEQLQELAESKGVQYDKLFLTYMIEHHKGAVHMVHELFATDGAAQDEAAFKLASDIQVDQITEINRMELMLKALTGATGDK